jgi:hypothetical protein
MTIGPAGSGLWPAAWPVLESPIGGDDWTAGGRMMNRSWRRAIGGLGRWLDADRRRLWLLVAILLLAAVTRLANLTWRSLDGDEGASLYYSDLPYSVLLTSLHDLSLDRHPLLFYVILKLWRETIGDSDLELRFLPAMVGLVTIALVYQAGRRRLGHGRAALAALLVTMNPLIVYIHQDVRMYGPALLLNAVAFYIVFAARPANRRQMALACLLLALAVAVAVYIHVLAVAIVPILGLLLLWRARRRPRASAAAMAALAVAGLALLPYFSNIIQTGNAGRASVAADAWLRTLLGAARTLLDPQSLLAFAGDNLLLLIGLLLILAIALYRDRDAAMPFALWLLMSLAAILFVIVSVEFFTRKLFAFAILPWSYLLAIALLGRGPAGKRSSPWPALVVIAFMVAGQVKMVQPGEWREDFRSAASFVEQFATEDDAVFVHVEWYQDVFDHYYSRPFSAPFPSDGGTPEAVGAAVEPYLDAELIWLVQAGVEAPATGLPNYSGDKGRIVQSWLDGHFPLATEIFPAGVEVRAYSARYRFDRLPPSAAPLDVRYANGLRLVGYRLAQTRFPATERYLHPPSTWVPLTLYWAVEQPLGGTIVPSLTIEDEQGNVWGGQLERDNGLLAFYPPPSWQPGEIVRWDLDVNVNPAITPGAYKLVVRVQDATGASLSHSGNATWTILERVSFAPPG